jgi:outer membrane protein TolC
MKRSLLMSLALLTACGCVLPDNSVCTNILLPEQRVIDYHDPAQLPPARIPESVKPRTVSAPRPETPEWRLSLDEAIRISLENARVIRVLAGTTATSSGQTIYDPAITNTTIDQAQARFDPVLAQTNAWSRNNTPTAIPDPLDPTRSRLAGSVLDAYRSDLTLSKTNVLGGQWSLDWNANPTRVPGVFGLPLNPQTTSAATLSYTQPLLQGAGYPVNMAPIVIARINTEQSYFQYKDSVQEMVRGVIEGYWNLVQARTAVWAGKIQVQQSEEAFQRAQALLKTGLGALSDVAQARVTYNQFRANLVAQEANVLAREGALRNLLGLPPNDDRQIVPVSAPTSRRLTTDWDAVVHLAEQRRPDIVELKLVAEADQQRLLQAQDQTLPRLDAVALYRWNGLSGEMPNEEHLSSTPGQFTDWSIGINFSVPLGLRQGRALVRQQNLLIVRDRANVEQGVHAAVHELAGTIRDLDSAYDQYLAFKETREAAYDNLKVQIEQFKAHRTIYLNVLQALNDWGNAVTSEAQQMLNYNIALATLERQTGTILETHGLVFYEERTRAAGPLGLPCRDRMYPSALRPAGSPQRYPSTGEPSENTFDLKNPAARDGKTPDVPPPPAPLRPGK